MSFSNCVALGPEVRLIFNQLSGKSLDVTMTFLIELVLLYSVPSVCFHHFLRNISKTMKPLCSYYIPSLEEKNQINRVFWNIPSTASDLTTQFKIKKSLRDFALQKTRKYIGW